MYVGEFCFYVVDVVSDWGLIDAQPWSLVTVAMGKMDVDVLAKVFCFVFLLN